jgi:hypothetical protein
MLLCRSRGAVCVGKEEQRRERRRPRTSIYRRGSADTRQPLQTQPLCIGGRGWLPGTAAFFGRSNEHIVGGLFIVFCLESDLGQCTKYLS